MRRAEGLIICTKQHASTITIHQQIPTPIVWVNKYLIIKSFYNISSTKPLIQHKRVTHFSKKLVQHAQVVELTIFCLELTHSCVELIMNWWFWELKRSIFCVELRGTPWTLFLSKLFFRNATVWLYLPHPMVTWLGLAHWANTSAKTSRNSKASVQIYLSILISNFCLFFWTRN